MVAVCPTRRSLIPLAIISVYLLSAPIIVSNPIPVYPDPTPNYHPPTYVTPPTFSFVYWLLFVFLMDFSIDILIMYVGLFVLDKKHGSQKLLFFKDFSRLYFVGSVLIISLVGIVTEWLLGMWIGGVFISLGIIFLSFYLVSKKLFHLLMLQSIFMGVFAIVINSITWIVIFSL